MLNPAAHGPRAPSIRRIQSKSLIRALRRRADGETLLVASGVNVEALSTGFDFSWVAMADHDALTTSVMKAVGTEAFIDLWVDVFTGSLRQKFLSGFTQFLTPFAGGSVLPLARRSPRVYEHLTRACGSIAWQERPDGGRLVLEDFPTGLDLETWALSNLGSLQAGALHLGRGRNTVRLEGFDVAARTAAFGVYDNVSS